jgi:antitoxin component of MazEF toxin-antitoxin module
MTQLKHQVFNQTKTGISIPNSILKEHLGIENGDMVFAVMANGRIILKRFNPRDLTDETDRAVLGSSTPTHSLKPASFEASPESVGTEQDATLEDISTNESKAQPHSSWRKK